MKKRKAFTGWTAVIKQKMKKEDGHYAGGLVAGAKILEFFGDAATKLCLRETSGKNEGLFRAYQSVDFLKPVHVGDTVVVTATIMKVGTTSRQMKFIAKIKPKQVIVAKAVGTIVIPELKCKK